MKKLRLQITLALVLAVVLIGCEQHAAEQVSPEEEIARDYEVDHEVVPASPPVATPEPMSLGLNGPRKIVAQALGSLEVTL